MRVPPLSAMGAGVMGLVVGASWPHGSFWGQSGSSFPGGMRFLCWWCLMLGRG